MNQKTDSYKKQLIKKSARELFFRFGFHKTAMDDIAGESGMAKATLYYYYQNKEDIFNEIVLEEAVRFIDRIVNRIPEYLNADEQLRRFISSLHSGLSKYVKEMADAPQWMCEYSPHGTPVVLKIREIISEKLRPILKNGTENKIFYYQDENLTIQTILHMIYFINHDWIREYDGQYRNQIINNLVSLLINGLKRSDNG